jgi:hypothetical protein
MERARAGEEKGMREGWRTYRNAATGALRELGGSFQGFELVLWNRLPCEVAVVSISIVDGSMKGD